MTNNHAINKTAFLQGMRHGLPIGLGYFAVSFSLGITAHTKAGLSPFQAFLASFLCNASAGEYAGFISIAENSTYFSIALVTLVTNARYILMSCALSQRISPQTKLGHRLLIGYDVTDELFGISIARPGYLNPFYTYGAILMSGPFWWTGTALGAAAGNLLPAQVVSALSVALYGMFLAVIIPPAKKSKVIAGLIALCFAASFAMSRIPVLCDIPDGTRTIILTLLFSSAAALLFPHPQEVEAAQ